MNLPLPPGLTALMNTSVEATPPPASFPDSDGKPMADNSRQLHWIVLLYCNLCWLFAGRQEVAVHGNMLWYPEEFDETQRQAPDVMVIFGRPPRDRGSYKQWEEEGVPVTVVFEIISPSNTWDEMREKEEFYEFQRVEEYYGYNPQTNRLVGYRLQGDVWVRIRRWDEWVSPRLGVRFVVQKEGLVVENVDGQPFAPFEVIAKGWQEEKQRADNEKQRADNEKQRADAAHQRADLGEQRTRRIVELGRKARAGRASQEEIDELDRLENEATASP